MSTREIAVNFYEIIAALGEAGDAEGIYKVYRLMEDLDATSAPGLLQDYANTI